MFRTQVAPAQVVREERLAIASDRIDPHWRVDRPFSILSAPLPASSGRAISLHLGKVAAAVLGMGSKYAGPAAALVCE